MLFSFIVCAVILLASFGVYAQEFNSTVGAFNNNQAQISVWLSAAAYCGKSEYATRTFKGPTSGFVVTKTITHSPDDTQGYVGYLPSDKSIYVVFRGSSSIPNWISDLDAFKTSYTSYPECNCQVHKGFYLAEQNVIGAIVGEVKRLKGLYPSYSVKTTGHSLGAALAQLTSMDLVKAGYPTTVYNFGQPRTGDKSYASFATAKVPTFRVVHNKDMVPHLPVTTVMEYYHVCTEEWENASGALKTCNSSCEDPTCSDQFALKDTNTADHSVYLGLTMSCSAVSSV